MTGDVTGIGDYLHEVTEGQCAIVAALVMALHESGMVPKERYRGALLRLWRSMPDNDAAGEAGAMIERVFDILDGLPDRTSDGRPPAVYRSADLDQTQKISALLPNATNDDALARPARRRAPWS